MKSPSHPSRRHRVTFLGQPVVLGSYLSPQRHCVYKPIYTSQCTSQQIQANLQTSLCPSPHMLFAHKWTHSVLGFGLLGVHFLVKGEQFDPGGDLPPSLPSSPSHFSPTSTKRPGQAGPGCREAWEGYLAGLHRASCQLSRSHLFCEAPPAPEGEGTKESQLTERYISTQGILACL